MARAFLLIFALLVAGLASANAANCGTGGGDCYWIPAGGAANWNATTNWSNTDGGGTCTCAPTTGDNIFFTSNSGTNTSTISASISIGNLDATGSSAVPVVHNSSVTLTVTGTTFKFAGSLTYTAASATRLVSFNPGAGVTQTVTSGGKTFGSVTIAGSATGTTQLADAMLIRADGTFTSTSGLFDAAGQTVSAGFYDLSGTTTRTVTLGAGTWTATGTSGTVWNVTTSANLTLTTTGSTVDINATAIGGRTIAAGGKTYVNFSVTNATADWFPLLFTGSSTTTTFTNLTFTKTQQVGFNSSSMQWTISGTFSFNGTSGAPAALTTFGGSILGASTISVAVATVLDYVFVSGITKSGAGTLSATNAFNGGGNTGWTSISAPSGAGGRIIGG